MHMTLFLFEERHHRLPLICNAICLLMMCLFHANIAITHHGSLLYLKSLMLTFMKWLEYCAIYCDAAKLKMKSIIFFLLVQSLFGTAMQFFFVPQFKMHFGHIVISCMLYKDRIVDCVTLSLFLWCYDFRSFTTTQLMSLLYCRGFDDW